MKKLLIVVLALLSLNAYAHKNSVTRVEMKDGVLYVYPDKDGNFSVDISQIAPTQLSEDERDNRLARRILANDASAMGSVLPADDPMFRYNSSVWDEHCVCTVRGSQMTPYSLPRLASR